MYVPTKGDSWHVRPRLESSCERNEFANDRNASTYPETHKSMSHFRMQEREEEWPLDLLNRMEG